MSVRRVVAAAVLLAGFTLLIASTYRSREFDRWLDEETSAPDRYVDASVRLHVVAKDPAGVETDPTKLTKLRTHRLGGWIDTQWTPPRLMTNGGSILSDDTECELGEGRDWYCSEDQEPVILHSDNEPAGKLALGGMGAGKTTGGVIWTYLRWLEHVGARWSDPEAVDDTEREHGKSVEGGITAPTQTRVDLVLNEMFGMFAPNWYRYTSSEGVVTMCDGTRIRAVSTYRQSASQGSRIQGFNWSWWLGDEMQDQVDEYVNIQARLRSAKSGNGKRLATATAKDASDWRTWRESLASVDWLVHQMLGTRSPFVAAEHWAKMKRSTSVNEYKRLVLAEDAPSELAVYYAWDRKRNSVARPEIATNVTPAVLVGYQSFVRPGARFSLLVGHDPGAIYNTSTIWRLLMLWHAPAKQLVPTWVAVGEHQTKQTTAREHARSLRLKLQTEFGIERGNDSSKALIFCDPHGKGEAATDYQSVYMAFQGEGLDVFNPAPMTGKIKRAARVEMMNRLMGGAADSPGVPRLAVASLDGKPLAPKLVESFESLLKKPGDDNPEGTQRKDVDDKTHAPASAAYALWPFEQESITAATVRLAMSEAQRIG